MPTGGDEGNKRPPCGCMNAARRTLESWNAFLTAPMAPVGVDIPPHRGMYLVVEKVLRQHLGVIVQPDVSEAAVLCFLLSHPRFVQVRAHPQPDA